jgi:hypothetical protein
VVLMSTKFQELITETDFRRLTRQLPGRGIGRSSRGGKTQLFLAIFEIGRQTKTAPV